MVLVSFQTALCLFPVCYENLEILVYRCCPCYWKRGLMLQQMTLDYNLSAWWYLVLFSPSIPQRNPLIPSPSPKGANWQADVLQKGYCSQNTAVLFWIKSCGALFILEYFYFLCTTYNHVLLTEIYFKEKKKIWKYSLKNTQKSLLIILYFYWSCLNV